MGGSRRKLKKSRPKIRVGLPRKKPGVFKPAVDIPDALVIANAVAAAEAEEGRKWDDKGSVIHNYRTFGVVSNPNILGVRARTPQIVQSSALQLPDREFAPVSEFELSDSGSDLESDEYKLGIQKKNGL